MAFGDRSAATLIAAQDASSDPLPFPGGVILRTGPAQLLTPQQRPGVVRVAFAAPPPPDQLGGAVVVAPWGLVQPVVRPTAPAVAIPEDAPPAPGAVTRSGIRPPHRYEPTGTQLVVRGADAPPADGRVVVGTVGFGSPRRPVPPVVVREPEVRAIAPHPGSAIAGKPPPPNLTPQEPAGWAGVARTEEPPPFPGLAFARIRPLVPSERLRTVPLVARAEEPLPFGGSAVAVRVRLGHPPPARFTCVVARGEEAPPFPGAVFSDGPAQPEMLAPQQMPGRVLVVSAEPPQPEGGRAVVLTGLRGGARPPGLGCAC